MFAHRLALAHGKSVEELVETMSPQAFTLWRAYYQMEPWGAWRDNWHAAQLTALLFNINRGKNAPVKVKDFMFQDEETGAKNQAAAFINALKIGARRANKT